MNPTPSNDNEDKSNGDTGQFQSNSGAGPSDGVDTTTTPSETYNLSNEFLGLHSDQTPDDKLAENQEVQLADNLGTSSKDSSASVAAVPPTYKLSDEYSDVQSSHQPSSEDNVASPSGPESALGSRPSSTGIGESDTNYQAFAPDQNTLQSTNQDNAALHGGGDSNIFALGGNSNNDDSTTGQAKINVDTGTDTLLTPSGNDHISGAYKPSTNLLGADSTTASPSGIDQTAQVV